MQWLPSGRVVPSGVRSLPHATAADRTASVAAELQAEVLMRQFQSSCEWSRIWALLLAAVLASGCAATAIKRIPESSVVSTRETTVAGDRAVTLVETSLNDEFEDALETGPVAFAGGPADFAGTHRKKAKTSIPDVDTECYTSIRRLLDTLEDDSDMMALGISTSANSDRVAEENRHVSVRAYLLAAKFEGDHDYHLILASKKSGAAPYLNVEVSGLPNNEHRAALVDARDAFEDLADLPSGSGYMFYEVVPVTVEGGLFYDVDHPPGIVGPQGFRPDTSWEIHPVTWIGYGHEPCEE